MVSKHILEETIFLNNDNPFLSDEEGVTSDEDDCCYTEPVKATSCFIHNDLKGVRKGGPLMDNKDTYESSSSVGGASGGGSGASKSKGGAEAKQGPEKRECPHCSRDVKKLYMLNWFRCDCGMYRERWACERCAFRSTCKGCMAPRKAEFKVDNDKKEERKEDKKCSLAWKSGDVWV